MKSFHLDREYRIIFEYFEYLDQIILIKLSGSNVQINLRINFHINFHTIFHITFHITFHTNFHIIFYNNSLYIFQSKYFKANFMFIYLSIHNFQLLAKSSKFFNTTNPCIPNFRILWIPRNFSRSCRVVQKPSFLSN